MDALKDAAVKMLDLLDLPGPNAPGTLQARLQIMAATYDDWRIKLVDTEIALRAAVEGRPVIVSPWREPGMTLAEKWFALAVTFPSLKYCPDVRALAEAKGARIHEAVETIVSRVRTGMYGTGKGHAATFVIGLFRNPESPIFDVTAAMGKWDVDHRAAFVAWSADPWWP